MTTADGNISGAASARAMAAGLKPRLRGVSHQWACVVAAIVGVGLVVAAPDGRSRLAAAIYAASVVGLFGTSAIYHRITWSSDTARRWMRRLDHSMIFVLIAGTYTPFALVALHGSIATAVLIGFWGGALGGIVLELAWIDAPKWLVSLIYVLLGWFAVASVPEMLSQVGVLPTLLAGFGGVLYTVGALVYACKRPDPLPRVFGYHEVFHALVILAAAVQYAVVAFWVILSA